MTLQAFSDDLDNLFDELRYGETFAQAVTGLWALNHQKSQLMPVKRYSLRRSRKPRHAGFIATPCRSTVTSSSSASTASHDLPCRTVRAADIKEYNKDIYESARILKPHVEARNDRSKPPDPRDASDHRLHKLARMWEAKIELADIRKTSTLLTSHFETG